MCTPVPKVAYSISKLEYYLLLSYSFPASYHLSPAMQHLTFWPPVPTVQWGILRLKLQRLTNDCRKSHCACAQVKKANVNANETKREPTPAASGPKRVNRSFFGAYICIYVRMYRHAHTYRRTYLGNGYTEPFKWSSEVEADADADAKVGLLSHTRILVSLVRYQPKTQAKPKPVWLALPGMNQTRPRVRVKQGLQRWFDK